MGDRGRSGRNGGGRRDGSGVVVSDRLQDVLSPRWFSEFATASALDKWPYSPSSSHTVTFSPVPSS